MCLCTTLHATIFYRWTTFPLLTYVLPPAAGLFSAWPGISNKKVALYGKLTSRAGGILKFLKHHFLYVNLETDLKESDTILPKVILLRSLHNTLNLSHHYSLLAEAIQDQSKIRTEKLTNISLVSSIYCGCSKFLQKKDKNEELNFVPKDFPAILSRNGHFLPSYHYNEIYKSHFSLVPVCIFPMGKHNTGTWIVPWQASSQAEATRHLIVQPTNYQCTYWSIFSNSSIIRLLPRNNKDFIFVCIFPHTQYTPQKYMFSDYTGRIRQSIY